MAFTIKLYNVSDDPRKLNKTLTGEAEVTNVRPTDIVDLMNPSFILDYNEGYTTKNYLWAAAPFNRFYFITDMKIDIGKKIVISCSADVLYTYRDDIKRINANVIRQEFKVKDMLPDPSYVYLNQSDVINVTPEGVGSSIFGNQIQNGYYIVLGVAGAENNNVDEIEGFTLLVGEPANWSTGYMFYWVNAGTPSQPSMRSIGDLISSGQMSANPLYSDVVAQFGGVYQKNSA